MIFEEFRLIEPLLRAVRAEGYTVPTPIQVQAIPHVLAGRDYLCEDHYCRNAPQSIRKADFLPGVVSRCRSWYTSTVSKSSTPIKLEVATGLVWLQAFIEKTHADTARWSVRKLDDTFSFEGLPDRAVATKLANFVAAKYRVDAHVYEPMGNGWQVVVMHR